VKEKSSDGYGESQVTPVKRLAVITASKAGRNVKANGADVFQLRDVKVVELWNANTDQYALDEILSRGVDR
jgi:hypothetical protein